MPSPATPGRAGTPSPPGQATSLPGWQASHWFNTPRPIELKDLRGRVVLVHAFQMLCPACVSHGLPQALRVHEAFQGEAVTVIGLHTVFEHHEVMGSQAFRPSSRNTGCHSRSASMKPPRRGRCLSPWRSGAFVAHRVSCCSIGRAAFGCIDSGLSMMWCWGLRLGSCWGKEMQLRPRDAEIDHGLSPSLRSVMAQGVQSDAAGVIAWFRESQRSEAPAPSLAGSERGAES